MKKFRKIMAVLVAAMMIMATMAPAWAESGRSTLTNGTDTGTINIKNAEDGETYRIFKILDLYSYDDDTATTSTHTQATEHYAYMIEYSASADSWYKFIYDHSTNNNAATEKYFTIEVNNPVTIATKTYYFVSAADNFSVVKGIGDEVGRTGSITGTSPAQSRATVQALAKEALDFAVAHNLTPTKTAIATQTASNPSGVTVTAGIAGGADTANNMKIVFSELDLGYYLVDSSIGTMVSLDTTNLSVDMTDKNIIPTIEKKVRTRNNLDKTRVNGTNIYASATRGDVWVENTDYEIGQPITFLTKITVPFAADSYDTAKNNYTYYDVLEKGFSLNATSSAFNTGALSVWYGPDDGTGYASSLSTVDASNYTVTINPGDGSDFKIEFKDSWISTLTSNSVIEIEYQAFLNNDAFVRGDAASRDAATTNVTTIGTTNSHPLEGEPVPILDVEEISTDGNGDLKNTNSGILLYGNASSTAWDTATVETYQFDLAKTKEDFDSDSVYDMLAGAEFELYRAKKDATGALDGSSTYDGSALGFTQATTVYTLPNNGATPDAYKLTTVDSAELNIRGLEKGVYYLKETKAPDGFQKTDKYIQITIADGASANTATVAYYGYNGSTTPATVDNTGLVTSSWDATVASKQWNDSDTNNPNGGVHIINKTSTELPSTGGMGTTVLYIVGGMLVILAGAYLFFSRKKTA